ncbi:alkaline-phosphatase-like protein [Apodospora peruviana]|uniref:Alkaline-phosphatase-like protein n=1 Tax=Apodospora peruviana TaxID=516989 RepID=A0AAE0ISX7_9PEZI|nr:alkaline-phosphatase-like protein [Apodospora peruviana]
MRHLNREKESIAKAHWPIRKAGILDPPGWHFPKGQNVGTQSYRGQVSKTGTNQFDNTIHQSTSMDDCDQAIIYHAHFDDRVRLQTLLRNAMPPQPLNTTTTDAGAQDRGSSLLSPSDYDGDAASIRSEQDTDSDDDERQLRARNSRELLAHDRLVLMEEEELDQLVTETRRRKERERRGSGLPVPNPLRILSRRLSGGSLSRSRSPSVAPRDPTDDHLGDEKRTQRRSRRQAKKDRLLADAQHGEDGELMYEMEEGGMKDGSSTGESSDREDSDEVDRKGLLGLADAKAKRSRSWRRWILVYALIAVAFAILFLLAWKLSMGRRRKPLRTQQLVSNGTAMFAPTTILISLDGFRADFLKRGLTPRLNAFIKEGVSPLYMLPSFPSVTFPNHYTLATGLYPESHGVVGNTFWDPDLQEEFYYTDPARSMDPKWWNGEPFWVTAERQGIKTAIHMWPGSEAHILSTEPTYIDKYKAKEKLSKKVDRVLEFLDMPDLERPQIIAAYVPNVDSDGHKYGPNSTEIRATIQNVDTMLDKIFAGLEERHLTNIVNVIVVSDHGMATTDTTRLIQLEDLVDLDKISHTDGWPLIGLRPKNPDELQGIHDELIKKTKSNPNVDVYLRDVNMPERYHFSKNERIAPLWIVPKTGWALVKKSEMKLKEALAEGTVYHPRGLHGYDHEHPLMRAIFVARGPAFPHKANSRVEAFQNTEVYNILCDSVGMDPMPNNGTLRLPLKPAGLHTDPGVDDGDTPVDPVIVTMTISATTTSSSSITAMATKPTKSIVVDPVTVTVSSQTTTTSSSSSSSATQPSKSLGVDLPKPPRPSGAESSSGGDTDGGDGDDEDDKGGVHSFWDWFTGKVDEWWGKVTGGGGKSSSDSESASSSNQ